MGGAGRLQELLRLSAERDQRSPAAGMRFSGGDCCYGMGRASERDTCGQAAAMHGRDPARRRGGCEGVEMMRLLSKRRGLHRR
jgi:hypothetical protein